MHSASQLYACQHRRTKASAMQLAVAYGSTALDNRLLPEADRLMLREALALLKR